VKETPKVQAFFLINCERNSKSASIFLQIREQSARDCNIKEAKSFLLQEGDGILMSTALLKFTSLGNLKVTPEFTLICFSPFLTQMSLGRYLVEVYQAHMLPSA